MDLGSFFARLRVALRAFDAAYHAVEDDPRPKDAAPQPEAAATSIIVQLPPTTAQELAILRNREKRERSGLVVQSLTLLFVAAYAIITALQLRELKGDRAAADRPYVEIRMASQPIVSKDKIAFRVDFFNDGISPAIHFRSAAYVDRREFEDETFQKIAGDIQSPEINEDTVPPGGLRGTYLSPEMSDPAEVRRFLQNPESFEIMAVADYSDLSGQHYTTQWCVVPLKTGATRSCKTHNELR